MLLMNEGKNEEKKSGRHGRNKERGENRREKTRKGKERSGKEMRGEGGSAMRMAKRSERCSRRARREGIKRKRRRWRREGGGGGRREGGQQKERQMLEPRMPVCK